MAEKNNLEKKVRENYSLLTKELIKKGLTITFMESITSGALASLITDTEGSSEIFKGSYVTYSNEMKIRCGVSKKIIDEFGVYSKETADAMATASRESLRADIGVGVTGSAANVDKNNSDSIPGSVFFSIDFKGYTESFHIEIDEVCERWEFKYYIADAVFKKIKKIINMG